MYSAGPYFPSQTGPAPVADLMSAPTGPKRVHIVNRTMTAAQAPVELARFQMTPAQTVTPMMEENVRSIVSASATLARRMAKVADALTMLLKIGRAHV